jgi:glycosyltransferase involved in cell wall biosynthesis
MPRVSVIIPNYNHESFLKLRIESILRQTYQDFEIMILDDHSTDGSRAIIEQYKNNPKITQVIYNDHNTGSPFKQWEKGIALAKSEWIWIAESDDYAKPDFLEALMPLTEKYENIGIAFSNSYKVDRDQNEEDLVDYKTPPFKWGVDEVKQKLCHYNTITNVSSCVINKAVALQAMKGIGDFKACGDWIFYTRLLQHSNLAYSPLKLNYYRWHNDSVSFGASKSGAYVTEGVHVMSNIDFRIVKFTNREFMALCKGWFNKLGQVSFKHRVKPAIVVAISMAKFFFSKVVYS